jgi:hypothetical protein
MSCGKGIKERVLVASSAVGPPLRSSGQSSWLQVRRPGFDSRHYQKKKVVGLERGPLSLVSTTEELLERSSENTAVGIRHADHVTPSIRKKLAITSPTSGGRSVGIVRSRTQTMEFSHVTKTVPSDFTRLRDLVPNCCYLVTRM